MNAYYTGTGFKAGTIEKTTHKEHVIGDRLIAFICAIVAMVTCPVAVKLEKATIATALVLAFFGVIGSMEANTVSIGLGVVLCLGIALVEFAIFKSMAKKSPDEN